MHGYGTCFTWAGGCGAPTYESGWHEIWVPMAWSDAGLTDWYGTGKYYTYINGQRYFQLSNAGSKPQYRYKTCSITTVEKYGEPTEWSFEREAQKPGRIESERKVYRYKDREMQVVYHFYKWGEWDKEWTEEALSKTDTRDRKEKLFYRYCDLITETTYYFERWTTPTEFLPEPAEPSDTLRVETKQEYCYRSKTEAEKRNPYADVAVMDAWFEAAMWVTEQGIMNGTSADTFDPNGTVTRGQMVMMLWRAAGKPAPEAAECPYQDVPEDSVFLDAVMWAAQEGIAGGATADTFGLDEVCIQGQAITFLYRAAGKPEVSLTQEPFADVEPDDYYYEPVLWAYERSISSGTSATEFGVNAPCTRTQVAVMLYRTFADK